MNKGLQALEIIKQAGTIYVGCASNIYTRYPHECKLIEKELKALEIFKKKVIPYSLMNRTMIKRAFDEGWITLEEYHLLKEVLL